jgi:hypothetical protein
VDTIKTYRHTLVALAFAALAIVALVFVPDERLDKLVRLAERVIVDPAGATAFVAVIAGALTTLRGAWMRVPPASVVLLALAVSTITACGAQLTSEQRTALAIETQRCVVNERAIVDRVGTTEEQDRADLAAERARCDAARAAITETP